MENTLLFEVMQNYKDKFKQDSDPIIVFVHYYLRCNQFECLIDNKRSSLLPSEWNRISTYKIVYIGNHNDLFELRASNENGILTISLHNMDNLDISDNQTVSVEVDLTAHAYIATTMSSKENMFNNQHGLYALIKSTFDPALKRVIQLNLSNIDMLLPKPIRWVFERALLLAGRFANIPVVRKAYQELGVNLGQLALRAERIHFKFATLPPGTNRPISWIYKTDIDRIYVNALFKNRLEKIDVQLKDDRQEVKTIIFAIAMGLVHELAHVAVQVAHPLLAAAPKLDSGAASPCATAAPATPTTSSQQFCFSTPQEFKEAGRFVERKLLHNTTGLVLCSTELQQLLLSGQEIDPNKAWKPKTWTSNTVVVSIMLDSCEHDQYACNDCLQSSIPKDVCKEEKHGDDRTKWPEKCTCTDEVRYKMMEPDFVRTVVDEIDTLSEQELSDLFAQQETGPIPPHHLAFSNKAVTISNNGSQVNNETDEESEDKSKFKLNWNHCLITNECGVAQRPPSSM